MDVKKAVKNFKSQEKSTTAFKMLTRAKKKFFFAIGHLQKSRRY